MLIPNTSPFTNSKESNLRTVHIRVANSKEEVHILDDDLDLGLDGGTPWHAAGNRRSSTKSKEN